MKYLKRLWFTVASIPLMVVALFIAAVAVWQGEADTTPWDFWRDVG